MLCKPRLRSRYPNLALLALIILMGCRGENASDQDEVSFPTTPDSNQFASFLNPAPGVSKNANEDEDLHNQLDFPEAYYNTIDPQKTRTTFAAWRNENGFNDPCEPPSCVSTHVKFRDTKDLGYGRNMFLRWRKDTGDVAIYVENFQVAGIPGVPYGPLNLEAMVQGDRSWNFGVNAIEFSSYPYSSVGAHKFAKFYTFAGDGKLAMLAAGSQQHFADLDGRGVKPMPTPCIVCHGGRGRTLVYVGGDGVKKVAPTIPGGLAGDLLANLQILELHTLEFANAPGFTEEENEEGIRLINEAVLSTYRDRERNGQFRRLGEWDPALATDMLTGKYAGNVATGDYVADYVPAGWNTDSNTRLLYNSLVGPNCMVCHALRGSALNRSIAFPDLNGFLRHAERIDQLVFERSLMPLGLLNYADFWENSSKNPAELARRLGLSERIDDFGTAIAPGAPVLTIAAPTTASGLNSVTGEIYDIRLSMAGSAFVAPASQNWSVDPATNATISVSTDNSGISPGEEAVLRVSAPGQYTVNLTAIGSLQPVSVETSWTINVVDQADPGAPVPPSEIRFFEADPARPSIQTLLTACESCHAPGPGNDGIPVHYVPCRSAEVNGFEFLYRSVLARVNFKDPLSSLLLRKPLDGATDIRSPATSTIQGYHAGGVQLSDDADISRLISWILNGAPRGQLPTGDVSALAESCL